MEYYVARAMSIGTLAKNDIDQLHDKENVIKRGLMPSEVRDMFGTKELKEFYMIPEDEEKQARHAVRVKDSIRDEKCLSTLDGGTIGPLNLDALHQYDWNVYNKLAVGAIDMQYRGREKTSELRNLLKIVPFALITMAIR